MPINAASPTSETKWADLFKEESFHPAPTAVFHSCPECGGLESSFRARFQRNDLDTKLTCGFCHEAAPLKRWLCECGRPWHSCEIHSGCFRPREDLLNRQALNFPAPARAVPNMRFRARPLTMSEDILADDRRRAKARRVLMKGEKRKADVVLGDIPAALKRPTLLGPILNERFKGVNCSSSSSACLR